MTDAYVWAEAYILDTQCSFGLVHGHEGTPDWIVKLYELVRRTGMREPQVKAMAYRSKLGNPHELDALAEDIANPRLKYMAMSS